MTRNSSSQGARNHALPGGEAADLVWLAARLTLAQKAILLAQSVLSGPPTHAAVLWPIAVKEAAPLLAVWQAVDGSVHRGGGGGASKRSCAHPMKPLQTPQDEGGTLKAKPDVWDAAVVQQGSRRVHGERDAVRWS